MIRLYATFIVDNTLFGVDATAVQEILLPQRLTRVPLAPIEVEGLANLRGQVVVTIDLRRRLGMDPAPEGTEVVNIVLRTDHGPVSIVVDEVGDVLEAHDDDLDAPPPTLRSSTRDLVTAVHKLDDRLLLVLDAARTAQPVPA